MNSNISEEEQSLDDCIIHKLQDVFLNCYTESDTIEANRILTLYNNLNNKKMTDISTYKSIYALFNSLNHNSFYFECVDSFDEMIEEFEYTVFENWWEELQELLPKLENIIISHSK